VMYAIYRSYRIYFGRALPQANNLAMAKGAGAAH